ncbi:MAG: M23 family metallopeptidase [Solirubrobacterales bacterium]|nr:M23 family metallopeptidase [Solirubrobacterales bacterium]
MLTFAAATATASTPDDGPGFRLTRGEVVPKRSVPASVRQLRVFFRFRARDRIPVAVRFKRRRNGRTVRRFVVGGAQGAAPGRWHRLVWNGRARSGRLAPPGRYVAVAGPVGGPFHRVARFRLFGHRHPIAGRHGVRGPVGEFGAGRTGGRTHEGFDATGRCGTPLVAVRSGRILKIGTDPVLYGNYVVLKGEAERRTYFYAHMRRPARVRKGQRVRAGRRLGSIGKTGNAASTPCHLHIEIRSRGRLLDPWPLLRSWLG